MVLFGHPNLSLTGERRIELEAERVCASRSLGEWLCLLDHGSVKLRHFSGEPSGFTPNFQFFRKPKSRANAPILYPRTSHLLLTHDTPEAGFA
jgi:hypothetical protein